MPGFLSIKYQVPCNVTVTHNSHVVFLSNDSVVYACNAGYNQSDGNTLLHCTQDGVWNGTELICKPLDCGPPLVGDNIQTDYKSDSNTTYGAVIEFVCNEGHRKKGLHWGEYICMEDGNWTLKGTDYNGALSCSSSDIYAGCYAAENFTVISQFTQISNCRLKCTTQNARFAGLSSNTCYCGDIVIGTASPNSSDCNEPCPNRNKVSPYYCGGPNGQLSVYTSREKMSSFISVGALNFSLRTAVYGNEELACKQLCSGANAYYALVQLGECMCTNTTDNGEFVQPNSTAASEDLITMHNLALYLWREKTCEKLYEKQVRNNGWYYMQENDAPVYCSFADGTPCENGWVGYAGSCYWFEMQYMNFDDSLSECLSKNSSLAPLRNKDIMSFVDGFIKDFHSDLYQVMWRFGATDVHSMSSYEWLDGSLSDEFFYRSGFPAYDYYDCLYLHKGSWIDGHCVTETPFICSKEQGMFRCVDFDEGNNPDVEVSKQTNAQMNRQLCIQICGGQLSVNALLKKKDCLCTNTSIESRVTYLPESECRSPCPGNEHQLCGGNNNKYSYKNGLNNIRAANCKVLERQGIGDINVMLLNSSQPTFCPNPECPFSWIKRPGYSSCYKFALSVSRVRSALEYCSSHSASLVSVDDLEELEFLQGLITNVQSDSSTSNWIIGFKATGQYSPYFRSSMGRQIGNLTFLDTTQEEYTYIYTTGPIKRFESTRRNFICEMSPEYVGCFLSNDSFPVALTSDTMTIELCVETCRIRNTTYALLSPSECRCNDTHLMNTSKSCKSRCANSKIQICGDSASSVSVYKIDEYSLYSSCETLFDSGIRIHGFYALKDGIQYCKFYDGSADCEEGWYALNGTCYSVLLNSTTGYGYQPILEWRSACAQQGGRLVSINNQAQHQFIAKVIMGSERLVKSVVLLGYFESILLGAPSWTSGSMSKYMIDAYFSGDSYQERALFQDQGYLNTVIGTSSDTPQASAAVCETEKDFVGVFQKPSNLVPLILRYGIMTLTQCKQVCVGADQKFAMVGRDTCWCGNSTDVDSLTLDFSGASKRRTGTNETFCQGNNIQRCPDGEKVDVYNLEYDNEYTAFSCDHLYSHGVFYNATYTIQNENGTSKQTCGFTDQTDCQSVSMFWGYRDHCYRFGTMLTIGETFTSQCIESDSLPFFPAENDELVSVLKLIVPVFQSETHLFIGTSNRLHNNHYTSSEGFFVRSHPDVTFNGSIGYMTLKMDTFEWEEASGKHFGICKSPVNGSIRCIDINSLNGSLLFEHQNIYPMTSSICIQLCLGRNASYGVVREQGCLCYANLTYEKKIGECKACSGHETQMCGDDSKGSGVLVDLDYYRYEKVQSCEELYSYGINIPGQYFIHRNGTNYLVTCFDRDPSLSVITDYSITISTESGISKEDYRINVFTNYSTDHSWKPEHSDTEPQIKFTFTEDYILTAIQTQGDVLTESWVTSYKLIYKNLGNEDIDVSINGSTNITGNIDRYSRVTQFFSKPIITRELRLYPLSYQQRVSLRVSLYGQPLSLFNHTTTYLGCFLNVEGDFVVQSLVSSEEVCRTTCKASYYQFYSFYENQDSSRHCFCGKSLYVYGTVQDNWCFPFTNSPALPVNRTYDTHCEEKIEEEASFISSFHPHSIDFFTLTSQIQFECNPGYILSNNATLKTVTCQETDGEYYWKDDLGKCIIKNCSSLELPDTGYTLSTNNVTFGTVVTVTCNNSLHMADGSGSKTVTCLSTAQWNDSVSSCSYNYCPLFPPTLPNGVYVLSQNSLSATFTCNQFYTLSSLKSQETISCQQNHQWEAINFTCEVNDSAVIFKQAEFDLIGLYERPGPADSVITENVFSSVFKCTDKCVKTRHCTAYAYNMQGGVCTLFKSRVQISDLIPTSSWKYFELKLFLME